MTLIPEIILDVSGNSLERTSWASGQALARYVLDHPDSVAGLNVIDFGTGGGQVAIAASIAGAAHVYALDIEPFGDAVQANAAANGVTNVEFRQVDARYFHPDTDNISWDILLAADVFYYRGVRRFLHSLDFGVRSAIIADPGTRGAPPFTDRDTHPLRAYGNVKTIPAEMEEEDYKNTQVKLFNLGERLRGKGKGSR